jgi:hypothetical protein
MSMPGSSCLWTLEQSELSDEKQGQPILVNKLEAPFAAKQQHQEGTWHFRSQGAQP